MADHEACLGKLDSEQVDVLFDHDPWLWNLAKSIWECAKGETKLTAYPWNFSIPIADVCNARCIFCTSWLEGRELVTLEQIDALKEPIKRALYVGLVGHGEPMSHPKFREIAARLRSYLDRRATLYTITNGYFLEEYFKELESVNVMSYSISLNAASAATHDTVMGLGPNAFDRVIRGVRMLSDLRSTSCPDLRIYITMVVTAQNVHEAASFVELGNDLGVTEIWLRSLLPQSSLVPGLNYHTLAPKLAPDFEAHRNRAIEAIARSRTRVQAEPAIWSNDILSPKIQNEVRLTPPPYLSRDAAVKDRDIRKRSKELYQTGNRNYRGALRNDPGVTVSGTRDGLEITTSSMPYSYAVEIALSQLLDATSLIASVELDVELRVAQGILSVGLLELGPNKFLERHFLHAGFEGGVTFTIPPGQAVSLVFENGQAEGGLSVGVIRNMILVREAIDQGPQFQATSLDILAHLKIHNAADPLEDGLNPLGRMPRFKCRAIYYNLYINEMFFRVTPCCYMQEVPGFQEVRFDGGIDFFEAWNSPALITLRRRLIDGPLYAACKRCPGEW